MKKSFLLETANKEKLMKQTDLSKEKVPLKRERQSLLKAIFLKIKREDVI